MDQFTPYVSWQIMGDTLYIIDVRDDQLYMLDGVAMQMCCQMAHGCTREQIVENIAVKYSLSKEKIKSDFDEFCTSVIQSGIMEEKEND